MTNRISYRVHATRPDAHLLDVELRIESLDPAGQLLSLPAWVPGSYLIRDFARHVVRLTASSGGHEVACEKTDKTTWRCAPCAGPLVVAYQIYAFDLSVRGAYLDRQHGFFDGCCVYLRVHGGEEHPVSVTIEDPGCGENWKLATSLISAGAEHWGFGEYAADNYNDLIDHPVLMGELDLIEFDVAGVPHAMAIRGRHDADLARIETDLKLICEQHHFLFGAPPPIDRYVFLLTVLGDGYGGLEHRYSSSLICARHELPACGEDTAGAAYRKFLGLCSHEYFHLWNVKRLRPAALAGSDLSREAYTEMLWVFEGITSYYDDLALVRSGVIGNAAYFELLSKTMTRVMQGPGRLHQSLAESSFDAWTKFYKQNENSPNTIVSYYAKGSLVALALDLLIRRESNGDKSLDDVMRAVWQRHGSDAAGMAENAFELLASEISGIRLDEFFDKAVRGTADLALEDWLADVGLTLLYRAPDRLTDTGGASKRKALPVWLGMSTREQNGRLIATHIFDGGPAQRAGVCAGDELLAMDSIRFVASRMDARLRRLHEGQTVSLSLFRRDELIDVSLELAAPPLTCCQITVNGDAGETQLAARRDWLGEAK